MAQNSTSAKKIGVGVIGVGIGTEHLDCYAARADVAHIVGICDIDLARGQAAGAKRGITNVVADYKEFLAMPELDAISVCAPNDLHAEISIAALKAGKHVLCEKPMTNTLANAEKIVEAVNRSPQVFMMAMNNRFSGETELMRRLIDEGALGEIYYAKCGWTRRNGIPGLGTWFTNKARSGGGPLLDIGVHALDRTVYLMGNPKPVSVSGAAYAKFGPRNKGAASYGAPPPKGKPSAYEVEDLACGLIKFDNGATLFLEASWASYTQKDEFYSVLLGTEGGAELPDFGQLRLYKDMGGAPVDIHPTPPKLSGRQGEINHFLTCIQEGKQPLSTAEQGLHILQILDAIYQSAQTGREVVIAPHT